MPTHGGSSQKSVNKDYCFRHAQMYEGWECPLCAKEKEQAANRAPVRAAGGGGAAAAPGPADTEARATTASRPASQARCEEAVRLLAAGAAREALETAQRAIELDRSNLQAYVVASRAADRVADVGRLEELLHEAAGLLHDGEYRRVSGWYVELLRAARDAAMARPVVISFISAGPWPPAESAALVRLLAMRGLPGEALRLIDALPPEHRSLTICAFGAQLTARAFAVHDPDVVAYLSRVSAADREQVLAEFREMCEENAFPISILMQVRDSLRTRYRTWKPEIRELQVAEARKAATDSLQSATARAGMSFAFRFAGVALAAAIVIAIAAQSGLLLLLGLLLAAGAAGLGFVYGRNAELERKLPEAVPPLVEETSREEENRWQIVLDDQSPLFPSVRDEQQPPQAAVAGEQAPPAADPPAAAPHA